MDPQEFRTLTGNREEQFAQYQPELQCKRCGRSGFLVKRLDDRGRWIVECTAEGCGSRSPDGQGFWVLTTADSKPKRKVELSSAGKRELWEKWHQTCCICGLTLAELATFGAKPDVHHGLMYSEHGPIDPAFLIPVCTMCHEGVNWVQRTVRRVAGKETI